jgi:hypothetical protein
VSGRDAASDFVPFDVLQGKTDVAMMSILRVLSQNLLPVAGKVPVIARNDFKIIYVAPMKALAAEITRKVGKRLAWVGIKVRELTGQCAAMSGGFMARGTERESSPAFVSSCVSFLPCRSDY